MTLQGQIHTAMGRHVHRPVGRNLTHLRSEFHRPVGQNFTHPRSEFHPPVGQNFTHPPVRISPTRGQNFTDPSVRISPTRRSEFHPPAVRISPTRRSEFHPPAGQNFTHLQVRISPTVVRMRPFWVINRAELGGHQHRFEVKLSTIWVPNFHKNPSPAPLHLRGHRLMCEHGELVVWWSARVQQERPFGRARVKALNGSRSLKRIAVSAS